MRNIESIMKNNLAYKELANAGFRPQGFDMKINKVVVMKIENEHTNNEHREIYSYDNWVDAAKSLIGKEFMTHNEYKAYQQNLASQFHHNKNYTMDNFEKDLSRVCVIDYDLSKYELSQSIQELINKCFDINGTAKDGNELFRGSCELSNVYNLATSLECKVGFDGGYSGFYYNSENKMILDYAEGDVTLTVCENKESYNECLQNTVEFYNKDYGADIHCSELDENSEIENNIDNDEIEME